MITNPIFIKVRKQTRSGHMGPRDEHAVEVTIGSLTFHPTTGGGYGSPWGMRAASAIARAENFERECLANGIAAQLDLTEVGRA